MNATAASPPQSSISDFLHRATEHVAAERFGEALKLVLAAKAAEPRNIYLIALEKQMTRLSSAGASMGKAEKKEIVDQLPNLFERALGAGQRGGSGESARMSITQSQTQPAVKQEKLQALKSQYFERADEFLERGDYQSALGEVRRVLIIEPDNTVAKKYEEKIKQLTSIQARAQHTEERRAPESTPARPVESGRSPRASDSGRARVSESGRVKVSDSGRMKMTDSGRMKLSDSGTHGGSHAPTEDRHARPAVPPLMPTDEAAAAAPMEGREDLDAEGGKSKTGLVLGLVAVVVVALGVGVFLIMKGNSPSSQNVAAKTETSQTAPSQTPAEPTGTPPATNQAVQTEMPATTTSAPATTSSKNSREEKKQQQQQASESKQSSKPVQVAEASKPATQQPAASTPPPAPVQQPPAQQQAAAPAETGDTFVPVEREPTIVKLEKVKVNPMYARGSGKIIAKVQIDPQGKPVKAIIVSSFNSLLNDAVIEAVMSSKYSPGMMTNGPVTSWLTIPFTFKQ